VSWPKPVAQTSDAKYLQSEVFDNRHVCGRTN
jgi:hypothetical protein